MSFNENTPSNPPSRRLIGVVALVVVLLCAATATIGYRMGRNAATPEPVVQDGGETAVSETAPTETVTEAEEEAESIAEAPAEPTATETDSSAGNEVVESENNADSVEEVEEPEVVPTDPPAQIEPPSEPLDLNSLDLELLNEAWSIIEGEFYGDLPSNDELLYGAIEGSLETLGDEFTRFTRPEIAELLREDFGGSVEGIGAFVRENEEGFVEIVAPIEGQPAEAVGLRPGDLVLEVDGEDVVGQDFYAIIGKVRGPRGTEVVIKILRPSTEEELTFTITRVSFEVPIVTTEMLDNDIAYIELTDFSQPASERLNEGLEELLAENPQALILDLRNNPGGFLNQSVFVADAFLTDGIVLFQRDSAGGEEVFRSDDGDIAEQIPLVVLINEGSASASEIVAGAIQDTGRGTLIGETSFGKGSVQLLHTLSDGSELRVTIARWFTPNDNTINGVGISPDIESIQDFDTEEDEQLERAIQFILEGE